MSKLYRIKISENAKKDFRILREEFLQIFRENEDIKFVSLVGVDLGNNYTDEKIPIKNFLENLESIFTDGIQTDGSSVNLPLIAKINDARVDIIPDIDADFIVDYNTDIVEKINGFYSTGYGTILIPSFLKHNNEYVDSRSILKKSINNFEHNIMKLLKSNNELLDEYDIKYDDIDKIEITTATELEFWVRTPDDKADIEALSISQRLKEQYWKRTTGSVRNAIEETMIALSDYGFEPEMAHKEVGGISSKITNKSDKVHIMEQLEIDWKYSTPMMCADNERIAKNIISDIFRNYFLEVTFDAKPIEKVAGSGEHHHIGIGVRLKNGKFVNILSPKEMKEDYLSIIGYGALMGILKNYEVINPFITSSYDAFNRLKPGFEAPICVVASIGQKPDYPSRNRTVLLCLIRDILNKKSTRFELRSPNPKSNSYLLLAASLQAMLDGIKYAVSSKKDNEELLKELLKEQGEEANYLEKSRKYVCEYDIFHAYPDYDKSKIFGEIPTNVYEIIDIMKKSENKLKVLKKNSVFTDKIIDSYNEYILGNWLMELKDRIILENQIFIKSLKKLHNNDFEEVSEKDVRRWETIKKLKWKIMKHDENSEGIFDKLRIAIEKKDYKNISIYQKEMQEGIIKLNTLYTEYKHKLMNYIDIEK